jgi:copper chaperone NosL
VADGRAIRGLLLIGVGWLAAACTPSEGPVPIAFDRQPCAECRMLISDPAFAAQLQFADRDTASFDDPGCLLRYRARRDAQVRAAWFHHVHEDRWLPASEVGFVPVPHSPMNYDLGAVDATANGAISLDEAALRVQERSRERRPADDAPR